MAAKVRKHGGRAFIPSAPSFSVLAAGGFRAIQEGTLKEETGMIKRLQAIRKRGFNLIEAAIVLGVVGAVIGGIWSATASFYEKTRFDDTLNGIVYLVTELQSDFERNLYSTGLMPYVVKAGLVPIKWKGGCDSFGNSCYVSTPYGGTAEPYLEAPGAGWPNTDLYFYIYFPDEYRNSANTIRSALAKNTRVHLTGSLIETSGGHMRILLLFKF